MTGPTMPLLEIGRGLARGGDALALGAAAALEAVGGVKVLRPTTLLVFTSTDVPAGQVVRGVLEAAPGLLVLGASAGVETWAGRPEPGVQATALATPHVTVHAALGARVSEGWPRALDEALSSEALAPWFGGSDELWNGLRRQGLGALLLLLAPGSPPWDSNRGAELVEALRGRAAHRVPVFAAALGDGTPTDARSVFLGERVEVDGLLVALISTRLKFGVATQRPGPGATPPSSRLDALRTAMLRGGIDRPVMAMLTDAPGLRATPDGAGREREAVAAALDGVPVLRLADLSGGARRASPAALVLGDELTYASSVARDNAVLREEVEKWFLALGQSNASLMRLNTELRAEVAERRQAQEALAAQERQQRALLDGISDFAWLKDTAGRYLAVNGPLARAVGLEPVAMVGRTDADLFPPALAEKYRRDDAEVLGSAVTVKVEEPFVDCAGIRSWVETIKLPWLDGAGQVAGLAGVARDVSQRRSQEEARWDSHLELERQVAERTAELERTNQTLQSQLQRLDASDAERQQLQAQLLQSQKMEAMGRLAASVAHDFNNVVTVILSGAAELGRDPAETPELAAEIQSAGERAKRLTRQLLAFSRQQPVEPRTVEVDELVHGFEELARRLAGRSVRLSLALGGRAHVHADPGQLEQVLLNLVANARDAMPGGGTLTVATSVVGAGDPEVDRQGPGRSWVRLSVSDTGSGMTEAVRLRIFEPFFTTKPKGEGTGLGLATVFGVVKQAGGFVTVESQVGAGSTFRVYLPRLEAGKLA